MGDSSKIKCILSSLLFILLFSLVYPSISTAIIMGSGRMTGPITKDGIGSLPLLVALIIILGWFCYKFKFDKKNANLELAICKTGIMNEGFKDQSEKDLAVGFYDSGVKNADEGIYAEAIEDFTRVIKLNPLVANAYFNRGVTCYKVGNFVQAIVDFTKVIELNPNNSTVYNNRAVAFYQLNEYDRVWEDVQKAQELGANVNPEFILMLKEEMKK